MKIVVKLWSLIQYEYFINSVNFPFQIDCHDSGTESDGDLDSEDFNERDMELSEYLYR